MFPTEKIIELFEWSSNNLKSGKNFEICIADYYGKHAKNIHMLQSINRPNEREMFAADFVYNGECALLKEFLKLQDNSFFRFLDMQTYEK